jgi:hypothetical protein
MALSLKMETFSTSVSYVQFLKLYSALFNIILPLNIIQAVARLLRATEMGTKMRIYFFKIHTKKGD